MDPAVIGAIIGGAIAILVAIFASITAPIILLRQTDQRRREDREADWARQDKVAEKAEQAAKDLAASQKEIANKAAEAASLLVAAQERTIQRADEVARLAAEQAVIQGDKLDLIDAQAKRIHTLVNSDMTAARQSELDQTRTMIAQTQTMIEVLVRVIALAQSRGQVPDPKDVSALTAAREALKEAQSRGTELEQILADRLQQMHEVEAEAARPGAVDPDRNISGEGGE
jgi:hypothetical protein